MTNFKSMEGSERSPDLTNVERSLSCYIPLGAAIVRPRKVIEKAGMVLFAGIILGVFIPGGLYYLFGTFHKQDIADRLADSPRIDQGEKDKWRHYTDTLAALQHSVWTIDAEIAAQGKPLILSDDAVKKIQSLVKQRAELQSALDKQTAKAPFHLAGFYLEPLMIMWPAFYICLGWLIVIFAPDYPRPPGIGRWILPFLATFVLYRWPTWMRNVRHLKTIERGVYANGNWDVSRGSFFVQEGRTFS